MHTFSSKNFYQIVLRPDAKETELLFAAKITTFIFGLLVICAATTYSRWHDSQASSVLMQNFSALVAGAHIFHAARVGHNHQARAVLGWLGQPCSPVFAPRFWDSIFLNANWIQHLMGWENLSKREQADLGPPRRRSLNVAVCSLWFLGSCVFANAAPRRKKERVEEFFATMNKPVDFEKEGGIATDAQQSRTLWRALLDLRHLSCADALSSPIHFRAASEFFSASPACSSPAGCFFAVPDRPQNELPILSR